MVDPSQLSLERILKLSVPLHSVRLEKGPNLSRAYIEIHTVKPVNTWELHGITYWVSLSPRHEGEKTRMHIILRGFDGAGKVLEIDMPMSMPLWYNTGWVDMIASELVRCYPMTGISTSRLPDYGTLRRLLATRIELYLRGGSAQRRDN